MEPKILGKSLPGAIPLPGLADTKPTKPAQSSGPSKDIKNMPFPTGTATNPPPKTQGPVPEPYRVKTTTTTTPVVEATQPPPRPVAERKQPPPLPPPLPAAKSKQPPPLPAAKSKQPPPLPAAKSKPPATESKPSPLPPDISTRMQFLEGLGVPKKCICPDKATAIDRAKNEKDCPNLLIWPRGTNDTQWGTIHDKNFNPPFTTITTQNLENDLELYKT